MVDELTVSTWPCKAVEGNTWYEVTHRKHTVGVSLPEPDRKLTADVVDVDGHDTLVLLDEDGTALSALALPKAS